MMHQTAPFYGTAADEAANGDSEATVPADPIHNLAHESDNADSNNHSGTEKRSREENGEDPGEPVQKRGRGRPAGSTQNRDKPPKSSTGGQSNFRDRAPKAFKRVGEIELHANGDAPMAMGPNQFRVECGLAFRLYNESVLKRGRPAAKGDGSVPGLPASNSLPPTVQLWLGKRTKRDVAFWVDVLHKAGNLVEEMGDAPIFDHDCEHFKLTLVRKETELESGLEASKPKGSKPRPEERRQPKEVFERKRNLRRALPSVLTRIIEIEKISNCVPKSADDFDCSGLAFVKSCNEGGPEEVPRVILYNGNPKEDLRFYASVFENLQKKMHDNEKAHFTSFDFKKLARLIVFRTTAGVDSYYDQKKLQSVAFIDSALQHSSEGHWQKKCDATRRALADQVAQNQQLQTRLAELEGHVGGDAARLRVALEQSQLQLDTEKTRVLQLTKENKTLRQKNPGDSERRGRGGYQASMEILQEEKRQMQAEIEHLRLSLSRSQEQVALLQLQGMAAASGSYPHAPVAYGYPPHAYQR